MTFALTLNPGFILMLGALAAFLVPHRARQPVMLLAGIGAVWLMFAPEFGAHDAFGQVGLELVALRLDPLSQVFGLGFITAALMLALASGARQDRLEDGLILLHAGGASTALFAGDLVSFIAAAEISALAGVGLVYAQGGPRAQSAGLRMFVWQALGGLILVAGAALLIAEGGDAVFQRIGTESPGGVVFLLGLLIKLGAPIAHVWVKDAYAEASPLGTAALAVFTTKLALYGLARGYGGEPILLEIGLAMVVIGSVYALIEDDLRRALAYGLIAQTGLMTAVLSVPTGGALGAVAALAFVHMLAMLGAFIGLGAIRLRAGTVSAAAVAGTAPMPLTAAMTGLCLLSVAALPGLAGYAAHSLTMQALANAPGRDLLFLAAAATAAATAAHTGWRLPALAFFTRNRLAPAQEAPFPFLLALAVLSFVLVFVGLTPGWLYALLPPQPALHQPFAPGPLLAQAQTLSGAAAVVALLAGLGLLRARKPRRLLDADALIAGPLVGIGRWCGVVLIRLFGTWQAGEQAVLRALSRFGEIAGRAGDRPYAPWLKGEFWSVISAAGLILVLVVAAAI